MFKFEQISHLCSSVYIVNFEYLIDGWVIPSKKDVFSWISVKFFTTILKSNCEQRTLRVIRKIKIDQKDQLVDVWGKNCSGKFCKIYNKAPGQVLFPLKLQPYSRQLYQNKLWHRCFPVSFVKTSVQFWRTTLSNWIASDSCKIA